MKIPALVAALVLSLLSVGGVASPASSEGDLVVTWPEVSAFNPSLTEWTFRVEDSGAGTLRAQWQGHLVDVPHQGDVSMVFPTDGEGYVTIERCLEESCVVVESSPRLTVHSRVVLGVDRRDIPAGPVRAAWVGTDVAPAIGDLDFTWSVTTEPDPGSGTVVSSGVKSVDREVSPRIDFYFRMPAGLTQGATYFVHVDLEATTERFGLLKGSFATTLVYDAEAPAVSIVGPATFYPVVDAHLDDARFLVRTDGTVQDSSVTVHDQTGEVVRRLVLQRVDGPTRRFYEWSGKRPATRPLPEGTYTVRFNGVDEVGNAVVAERAVRLSHQSYHFARFKRTVSAADSLVRPTVGRCSTLSRPSAGGVAGALGLYSQTRCRDPKQSVVATLHGIRVPEALDRRYGTMRVDIRGGAAPGQRDAYLVTHLLNSRGDYQQRRQLDGTRGLHRGVSTSAGRLIWGKEGSRPSVFWSVGLTDGSRYDVKSFTVDLTYYVFR